MSELRESKTISSWRDLEEFGIDVLTGESCAYSLRLLCDLDQNGLTLIKEFFGMPQTVRIQCVRCGQSDYVEIPFGNNWNTTGCTPLPHIASVMLPRSIFSELATYILLREGYHIVIVRQSNVIGYTQQVWEGEFREIYEKSRNKDYRIYSQPTNPARGGRHVHMMSGRTA